MISDFTLLGTDFIAGVVFLLVLAAAYFFSKKKKKKATSNSDSAIIPDPELPVTIVEEFEPARKNGKLPPKLDDIAINDRPERLD